MATKLGSLLIELGLDSAKFRSGTRKAQREMSSFQRSVTGGANLVKGALAGMVSALSVDMFAQVIKSGLDYASSLGEVAQQLGVTTRTLQEYRYAATQVGLTQEEMDASLARLTRSMGQAAAGSKAQAEAFASLGIDIRAFVASGRDAGDLLPLIADGLKGMSSAAQRAAIETAIFGKAGQKLETLLSGGASEINNLRDAAHRLGVVLSDQQIQNADEAADKLAAVQTVLQARIAGVVADNSTAIIDLANSLATLASMAIQAASAWQRYTQAQGNGVGGWISTVARHLSPAALISQVGEAAINGPAQSSDPYRRLLANSGTPEWMRRRAPTPTPIAPIVSSGGGGRRSSGLSDAARETSRAAEDARRALSDLLDELNPVAAKQREFTQNMTLLNNALRSGQLTVDQHRLAVEQLRREYANFGEGIVDWRDVLGDVSNDVSLEVPATEQILSGLADHWDSQAERMQAAAERQQQALFDMLGSIRNFANSLKSGDILGIIEGVFGLLESIGSMRSGGINIGGLKFGNGAFSRIPRFAGGTNFAPGGLAWVGERGPELLNLPRGASVTPNHALKGMTSPQVQIVPSPYFDVVVDGRVMRAAPGIAAAGSQGAQIAMARRGTRRLA